MLSAHKAGTLGYVVVLEQCSWSRGGAPRALTDVETFPILKDECDV